VNFFQREQGLILPLLILVLMGSHLRHGVWSAFQSLGLLNAQRRSLMVGLGTGLAVALTLGFLAVPWAIYLGWIG